MKLDNPADIRNLIKKFIIEMDEDGFQIPQPGAVAQMLNIWLRCWEIERETETEKRICALEKKILGGGNYEREKELELD